MKKQFITLTIILSLATIINAQGITNTLGGNTANDNFIVENSDSEAGLAVTGEGNVGIGTTNPIAKLHVSGEDGVVFTGTNNSGTIPIEGVGTRMMWYPKKAAFRAGYVNGTQWNDANIGSYSTAMNYNTTASGNISTAMGNGTTASGYISTAMGEGTTASADRSTAMGKWTTASGYASTAMGTSTQAQSRTSLAIGRFNVGGGNPSSWVSTDPLFEIGIGADNDNRANALTVLKNGKVGIGTATPSGLLDVNGSIYQRGGSLHADYVFDDDYELETIQEHADFMWSNKHLPAIPKGKVDENGNEIVEVGAHRKGIVEELEKAHIYISQLEERITKLEKLISINN